MRKFEFSFLGTSLTSAHETPTLYDFDLARLRGRELHQIEVSDAAFYARVDVPVGLENSASGDIKPVRNLCEEQSHVSGTESRCNNGGGAGDDQTYVRTA